MCGQHYEYLYLFQRNKIQMTLAILFHCTVTCCRADCSTLEVKGQRDVSGSTCSTTSRLLSLRSRWAPTVSRCAKTRPWSVSPRPSAINPIEIDTHAARTRGSYSSYHPGVPGLVSFFRSPVNLLSVQTLPNELSTMSSCTLRQTVYAVVWLSWQIFVS